MTVESVWDYPRPPVVELSPLRATIELGGLIIADSTHTRRVLETSHPPVHYFPPEDLQNVRLESNPRRTYCEFKGMASYWDLALPDRTVRAASWSYPDPNAGYEELRDHVAFYPSQMDRCTLGGEEVVAQAGDFYGGWITSRVAGPFKGGPGTSGW